MGSEVIVIADDRVQDPSTFLSTQESMPLEQLLNCLNDSFGFTVSLWPIGSGELLWYLVKLALTLEFTLKLLAIV
jgi:hypothetical protein